jgi:TfoX/Sxy family transcriptional regulator of competence genes
MPPKGRFNEANKAFLDEMLLAIPGVEAGKMFGHAGYKTNDKVFAIVWGDAVAIKVGQEAASELVSEPHISQFEPRKGQAWKEWVSLARDEPEGFAGDEALFLKAVEYIHENT